MKVLMVSEDWSDARCERVAMVRHAPNAAPQIASYNIYISRFQDDSYMSAISGTSVKRQKLHISTSSIAKKGGVDP